MRKFPAIFVLLMCFFFFTVHAEASGSQLIIINKKTNTLAFYDGGTLVKTFRVATGRKSSYTPEGTFRIVNKIKNRPYYKDNIPGGDPRNPLGDRWLGLEARGTYGTTYGIHGNNNENSIGRYVSAGCVRMHNQEVRWLFEQVQLYTTVIITHTDNSFDAIAQASGYHVAVPTSAGSTNGIAPVVKNGWVKEGNKKYYYENGAVKKGWQEINGKWYFFDESGVMMTGWLSNNGEKYYLDEQGSMLSGWQGIAGKKYYFGTDGEMKTGWLNYEGNRYLFDEDGAMKTGWGVNRGNIYYFNAEGSMQTGWVEDGGKWYYLESTGVMQKGWINIAGKWYYLNSKGFVDPALTSISSPAEGSISSWLDPSLEKFFQSNTPILVQSWIKYKNRWYYLNVDKGMAESARQDGA